MHYIWATRGQVVDKMNTQPTVSQHSEKQRKVRLSPDVAEFLDILNALESRGTGTAKTN